MGKKHKGLPVPYFQVPNDVFEISLTTSELAVYIYLFRCSNQGTEAFPSYATIGKKTGLSRRSAIYLVEKLVKRGLVLKRSPGWRKSNIFEVILPGGATIAPGSANIAPAVVHGVHPIKNKDMKNQEEEKNGSEVFDYRLINFHEYAAENEVDEKAEVIIEYILERFQNQIGLVEKLNSAQWEKALKNIDRQNADWIDLYIKKAASGKYKAPTGLLHFLSPGVSEILFREGLRHERKFG